MAESSADLEKRVAALEAQLAELTRTVDALHAGRGEGLSAERGVREESPRKLPVQGGTSEEILSWVDKSYILSRVATTAALATSPARTLLAPTNAAMTAITPVPQPTSSTSRPTPRCRRAARNDSSVVG